jgi:Domain of unknown function (DUF4173)
VLLAEASFLGIAADFLFRGQSLGVNVFIWSVLFVLGLLVLVRLSRAPFHQGRRLMLAPLLLFSALLVWRDSPLLVAVNAIALAVAISLGALRRGAPSLERLPLSDYVGGAAAAGIAALAGVIPIVHHDVDWRSVLSESRSTRAVALGRGFAIALPLLLLFGGLFVAADAVFKQLLASAIPGFQRPALQLFLITAFGWTSGGLLRDLVVAREEKRQLSAQALSRARISLKLRPLELVAPLAALNLLFLAFVLVQLRYLFGGRALVAARAHLTYAQYARHGFFELALLVLPLLLLADWTCREERGRGRLAVRALSAGLIALVFVVMASALERMRLYEQAYGMTELRLYATGIILWLALVFVWFAVTVLRSQRQAFAIGALIAGLAASLVINALNPDALIVRTNLSRPSVDVGYLSGLSDDAIPVLVNSLPRVSPQLRRALARRLLARSLPTNDWRSWNLSRDRARASLIDHRAELSRYSR